MLKHLSPSPAAPARAVVIGAAGFVGKASVAALRARGVPVTALARADVDLLADDAAPRLALQLRPGDTLVVIAAKAPVKDHDMLVDNLRMMAAVCSAMAAVPPGHLVYVSSDAVYADSDAPLTEASCAQPASLHGVMHLAREVMLANAAKAPLCVLRPTLIYGAADPHNGYGPNRFRRLAHKGEPIVLSGDGEERRDHVCIDDVAELVARCVVHRSEGALNIATGTVTTFRAVAEQVAALAAAKPTIRSSPRSGPMPHRGYRAFDASATGSAFPDFRYTTLAAGLALSQQQEFGNG